MIHYVKYHGLGNDYLVVALDAGAVPSPEVIRRLCHRHYGVGGDGVLLAVAPEPARPWGVRIFNPDGSEAEKSGNGLRIFARYLFDQGRMSDQPFPIQTQGGLVRAQVQAGGRTVTVDMGAVSFHSTVIPVAGPPREVLNEPLPVLDRTFHFCAASVGNPHCVIRVDSITQDEVLRYGPVIERDPRFPNRTNVQFMRVMDRHRIELLIWERGAGYTLASGSSSCAAAAVAHRLGLCDRDIRVVMPGGHLQVRIGEDGQLTQTGPVVKICEGAVAPEMLADPSPLPE